jgi:hypothetical protein
MDSESASLAEWARRPRSVAALIHGVRWEILEPEIELSPGIKLANLRDTAIGHLYERACREMNMDHGDPFLYDAYILLEPTPERPYIHDYGDPYAVLDRVCNIIALELEQPIAMCRTFSSGDYFKTFDDTFELYHYGIPTETLSEDWGTLTDVNKKTIRRMWQVADDLFARTTAQGRLVNSLTYFYLAWRSHVLEQVCINLAICLEVLFAPHSQSEVSHQISFNASRFMASKVDEREEVFNRIRKFYKIRSTIVHGGRPDDSKLFETTRPMFCECARILKKILSQPSLAHRFEEENERQLMMREFLFH